ncbi:MAG TPA: NmrA family NAD(P)-binding protein [Chroococcales cyanobacterium]
MTTDTPILVTGAAGSIGSVGRRIVKLLRKRSIAVRAMVHRLDERAQELTEMGAEVVVGDLTNGADVVRALKGCQRMYFGMSVSEQYLQATAIVAAAIREIADFEMLVNISQLTVSQMTLTNMTKSKQQQLHWLSEEVLNWSGIPVAHIRSTVFLEHFFFSEMAAKSIANDGTIRLPFGNAKTSPISANDVARVAEYILEHPDHSEGQIFEITGPHSQDMSEYAKEYAEALGRPVMYINVPFDEWLNNDLLPLNLPDHVFSHIKTMAELHADNRYDRFTDTVEELTGKPSMSLREYVIAHPEVFSAAMAVK